MAAIRTAAAAASSPTLSVMPQRASTPETLPTSHQTSFGSGIRCSLWKAKSHFSESGSSPVSSGTYRHSSGQNGTGGAQARENVSAAMNAAARAAQTNSGEPIARRYQPR
jgi:hypothetical protein